MKIEKIDTDQTHNSSYGDHPLAVRLILSIVCRLQWDQSIRFIMTTPYKIICRVGQNDFKVFYFLLLLSRPYFRVDSFSDRELANLARISA